MYTYGKIKKIFENGLIEYEGNDIDLLIDGSDSDVHKRVRLLELNMSLSKAEENLERISKDGKG